MIKRWSRKTTKNLKINLINPKGNAEREREIIDEYSKYTKIDTALKYSAYYLSMV